MAAEDQEMHQDLKKIEEVSIVDRLSAAMEELDLDGDGTLTLEELKAGFARAELGAVLTELHVRARVCVEAVLRAVCEGCRRAFTGWSMAAW